MRSCGCSFHCATWKKRRLKKDFSRGVYHCLAFYMLWRRARPRQFEGAAPEDDTKGELRRRLCKNGKDSDILPCVLI